MTLKQREQAFVQLGLFINRHFSNQWLPKEERFHNDLQKLSEIAYSYNGWFTPESISRALNGIAFMLEEQGLARFASSIKEPQTPKTVAVIMAGNIPAVGFHDLLCVLLSGHNILIKVSSDDPALIPFLAGMLIYYEKGFAPAINFSEGKLIDFDAVIATGSDNTAKHFEYYFGKYPHIIRKNRSSIAVLNGQETKEELTELGKDIFYYYGLGCRNVNKIYVPEGYVFDKLFEALYDYKYVLDNKKYNNNYEYNRAIYLLDLIPFLDNNFLMIKESTDLHALTSVLFYETYTNQEQLVEKIRPLLSNLQCIVTNFEIKGIQTIALGCTQKPDVFDFADNVNTLDFLNTI
ncbi:MAG: acyl-CoA reductase [Bacteroidetes bacterium]|nr:acyl-CoA reductase [Bacteroidota bacterium]